MTTHLSVTLMPMKCNLSALNKTTIRKTTSKSIKWMLLGDCWRVQGTCRIGWCVLNIVEGEPWTDGGWTKIQSKTKEMWHVKVATGDPSIVNNGHEEIVSNDGIVNINAMKIHHCKCDGDSERGNMCDREWRKKNQQLKCEIGYID